MKNKRLLIIIVSAIVGAAVLGGLLYLFLGYLPKERKEREFAQAMKDYYDAKVATFEQENASKVGVDVAFIGDSLTDGYDVARYYTEFSVANRGIGGDTTFGVEERLDGSVIQLKPRVLVMMIGSNNIYNMFDNYESLLIRLKNELPDTKVVLMSIPPTSGRISDRNVQIALNNVKIKALAEKYGYTYVDIFTLLLDHENDVLRAEYTFDGAHFTDEGYEVITAELKPVLLRLLEK